MRKTLIAQRSLFDQSIDTLVALFKPDAKLRKMDQIMEANPQILELVHNDLTRGLSKSGAWGMSAEQVLRAAIIRQWKQYSYRELADRLQDGVCLRWFTRFYSESVPHFTSLQKVIKAIGAATWEKINDLLVQYAKAHKLENGKALRTDTTVVATDIHYPTDARLLWDSIRVLTRLMIRCRQLLPEADFGFVNRTKSSKKLCYKIAMAKGPKAPKKRRQLYRRLVRIANEVFAVASHCCGHLQHWQDFDLELLADQLDHYLTLSAVVIDQCERRVLLGETVPAADKIVSIFEEHTDIIKRGKSQAKTEFGHKVLITSGKSGLITQYESFRGNPDDGQMLPAVLARHLQQYGRGPTALSADRRFYSAGNESKARQYGVKRLSINKSGYRSQARIEFEKERWFKDLQRFRAGIEGIISALMRGYGLKRCLWKGWQSFQSYVGLAVVTFNLQKIAELSLAK
jgi:IS5 family transposase